MCDPDKRQTVENRLTRAAVRRTREAGDSYEGALRERLKLLADSAASEDVASVPPRQNAAAVRS